MGLPAGREDVIRNQSSARAPRGRKDRWWCPLVEVNVLAAVGRDARPVVALRAQPGRPCGVTAYGGRSPRVRSSRNV
jgi:hypothetical protein